MSGRDHRTSGERGVVLVIMGVAMTALLVIAALVVDLGAARWHRRNEQSDADLAAVAAGLYLAGHGTQDAVRNPQLACRAALASLQENIEDFTPRMTTAETTDACRLLPVDVRACPNGAPDTVVTRGQYRITVSYPVPDAAIADGRLTGGRTASDGDACDRIAVQVLRTSPTVFAGVIGVDEVTTDARAVVTTTSRSRQRGVAALLLLERLGCGVLETSGGGSEGGGVVVRAISANNPGVIQVDSAGRSCSGGSGGAQYVVYGTALPAASGGGPSIAAEGVAGGRPPVLGMHSLTPAVSGAGAAVVGSGVAPAPVAADVVSRQPADERYNSTYLPSIADLHLAAWRATTGAAPGGAATISGAQCNGLTTAALPAASTATTVYVSCADFRPADLVLAQAATVILTGKLTVANTARFSLPAARSVYVRGCTSACSGGQNYAVSVAGELRINTVAHSSSSSPACAARTGSATAVLATLGGPFLVPGQGYLCQTTAYLGVSAPSYVRASDVTTQGFAACAWNLPCPSTSGGDAYVNVGGSVDWSAPNRLSAAPTTSQLAANPFEDLALWSETSSPSALKGQGANRTEGVYFLPNSAVEFYGQGNQDVPLNAQFWARTLRIRGQGTLTLRPNPADAIPTPMPGSVHLIR